MADIILKHNAYFMGTGGKLLRYRPIPVNYGLLYNWYVTSDARKVSSSDNWRVSLGFASTTDNNDCMTLLLYCDADALRITNDAALYLKETGTTYWNNDSSPNNSYKLNVRGNGYRKEDGVFENITVKGQFWANSIFDTETSKSIAQFLSANNVFYSPYRYSGTETANIKAGVGIRLVNTSTTLSHGQTGTYTGNNGREYPTICIGTQEWLADNLAETKYRNGDTIPEVTDGATWAGLTTGALCAYNNDWNNV